MRTYRPHVASGISVLALTLARAAVGMPAANADVGTFVQTQSGAVICDVLTDQVGCEHVGGFSQTGGRYSMAVVGRGGGFQWIDGDIGSCGCSGGPMVLNYGTGYHINGWTIRPSFDGTRFTNDATNRGMFVSIDNVSSF